VAFGAVVRDVSTEIGYAGQIGAAGWATGDETLARGREDGAAAAAV
jgi:hypothetical protein